MLELAHIIARAYAKVIIDRTEKAHPLSDHYHSPFLLQLIRAGYTCNLARYRTMVQKSSPRIARVARMRIYA